MRSIATLSSMKGQVALITGGAGHIGSTVSNGLAELGCTLFLLDRPSDRLEQIAEQISRQHGVAVYPLACDLENEDERVLVREQVMDVAGRLDVLVHCAAFVGDTKLEGWVVPFPEQGLEAVRRCLEVNLTSAFHLSQLLAPMLAANGNGRILNVGSIYGVVGPDLRLYDGTSMGNPAAYAMSKGGLVQLTHWMATVLAPKIRVNAISLGGVFRQQPDIFVERYVARTPMARMATEEDFIGAAAFFCSDLSAYVTGQNLMIDGGWTAW